MISPRSRLIPAVITLALSVGCSALPPSTPTPTNTAAPPSTPDVPTHTEVAPISPPADPFILISQDNLFAYLEALTAIQPYSGWRNSATQGEAEALDYVAETLGEFAYLQEIGLELEREHFNVFLGNEIWETRLHLTVGGEEIEVPADGVRGLRDDIPLALHFDSDGALNDSVRDPVVVEGPVVLIRSAQEIEALSQTDLEGKVVILDYAVINFVLHSNEALAIATDLVSKEPAGLVLVTEFSNEPGESHGAFVGDGNVLTRVKAGLPPTLYARMEDLAPAGITGWDDLSRIEAARLTWDADVFSPAPSGNLVAHIPGVDPSQAVILGAHIDSPNSPGALDDGSGSVILLEVARVLNEARSQPPEDVYLVWFGSEELGLYGSYHFVSTHQELLDRTLAMLQIDALSRPLDGFDASHHLITWSYGRLGNRELAWPDYLSETAAGKGIEVYPVDYYGTISDNTGFSAFGVPNADLVYMSGFMESQGGIHYASHWHDPYDTVDLAREMGDELEQMTRVALTAALETGRNAPDLRVTPAPDRRALFVASHTEPVHMHPTSFTELGMALTWEGFDVDLIPYGQAVTPADLENADLVVVLPVIDYPCQEGDPDRYDEAWSQAEVDVLVAYVDGGGLLVLANSAHRLKIGNSVQELNEDWGDINLLAERFGISYHDGLIDNGRANVKAEHPLMSEIMGLDVVEGNGIPFSLFEGQVLAQVYADVVAALVDYGENGGQVLALADTGILGATWEEPVNLPFWLNLARYARSR